MGLDFVEITMDLEKTLSIKLSDDDFQNLLRNGDILVGDLYDNILNQLGLHDELRYDVGLNFGLYAELRDVLHAVTEMPLASIRLDTGLAELFPRETRRDKWDVLRSDCRYRVRDLDYPVAVSICGFCLALGMVAFEQLNLMQFLGIQWLWPVLGILGLLMVTETYFKLMPLFRRLRNRLPPGMVTVKDLCRTVFDANYADICIDSELTVDPCCIAVWDKLVEILVGVLAVEADEITFRSRLVGDLRMG